MTERSLETNIKRNEKNKFRTFTNVRISLLAEWRGWHRNWLSSAHFISWFGMILFTRNDLSTSSFGSSPCMQIRINYASSKCKLLLTPVEVTVDSSDVHYFGKSLQKIYRNIIILTSNCRLRPHLRRITLDGLQSKDRIRVDGVLPLHNIEQLTIRQGKTNPALIANEVRFHSVAHISD